MEALAYGLAHGLEKAADELDEGVEHRRSEPGPATGPATIRQPAVNAKPWPYVTRNMTVPAAWVPYLLKSRSWTDLAEEAKVQCDALQRSVNHHGWYFAEAIGTAFEGVPMVPESDRAENRKQACRVIGLRRYEHPLLPEQATGSSS